MALTIKEKIKILETVEDLYELVDSRINIAKHDYEANERCMKDEPENENFKKWTEEARMEKEAWEVIREAIEGIDRAIKM